MPGRQDALVVASVPLLRADVADAAVAVEEMLVDARTGRQVWWWADALYMAPPMMARFAAATGRPEVLALMDRWYWDAVEHLIDPAWGLFYRDEQARREAAAAGAPVFWGRGNAWVLAGLANLLPFVPADHPARLRYEQLFQGTAEALLPLQAADGFWHSNLTEAGGGGHGESSATALFAYALAWGVNEGLLPEKTYWPAVARAWHALSGAVTEEGRLGWVQREARAPGLARRFDWDTYGSGAMLMAGSEILRRAQRVPR